MASLEAELSEVKLQTHIVEQENLLLKDELEQLKQVSMRFLSEERRVLDGVLSPAPKGPLRCGCSTSVLLQAED